MGLVSTIAEPVEELLFGVITPKVAQKSSKWKSSNREPCRLDARRFQSTLVEVDLLGDRRELLDLIEQEDGLEAISRFSRPGGQDISLAEFLHVLGLELGAWEAVWVICGSKLSRAWPLPTNPAEGFA